MDDDGGVSSGQGDKDGNIEKCKARQEASRHKNYCEESKNVAIVKNTADFLEKIAEMQQIPIQDAWYRVCLDGGGGSFKSVVSVIDRCVDQSRSFRVEAA